MVFPVCNGVLQRMQLPRTWEGNVALFTKKSRDTKICWRGQNIQSHNLLDVLFEWEIDFCYIENVELDVIEYILK